MKRGLSGGEFAGDNSRLAGNIFVSYVGCSDIEMNIPERSAVFICIHSKVLMRIVFAEI